MARSATRTPRLSGSSPQAEAPQPQGVSVTPVADAVKLPWVAVTVMVWLGMVWLILNVIVVMKVPQLVLVGTVTLVATVASFPDWFLNVLDVIDTAPSANPLSVNVKVIWEPEPLPSQPVCLAVNA